MPLYDAIPRSYIGAANGVAPLDASGNLPVANLPPAFEVTHNNYFMAGHTNDYSLTGAGAFENLFVDDNILDGGSSFSHTPSDDAFKFPSKGIFLVSFSITFKNLSGSELRAAMRLYGDITGEFPLSAISGVIPPAGGSGDGELTLHKTVIIDGQDNYLYLQAAVDDVTNVIISAPVEVSGATPTYNPCMTLAIRRFPGV